MPKGSLLYHNAKIYAKLSQRLSKTQIESLSICHTLTSALDQLQKSHYKILHSVYQKTQDLVMVEYALKNLEIDSLLLFSLGFSAAEKKFILALLMRYEIENLKNALSLWLDHCILKRNFKIPSNISFKEKIIYTIPYKKILHCHDFTDIIESLMNTPYMEILSPYVDLCKKDSSVFFFHAALDLFYYQRLKRGINNLPVSDRLLASRFFGTEVDFENLIFRMRFQDSPVNNQIASQFFFPGGRKIQDTNIQSILQAPEDFNLYLKNSYPMSKVSLNSHENSRQILEVYRNTEMQRLSKVMRTSNPLSIAPVILYFYWVKWEHKIVLGLLHSAYYGLDQKTTEEMLCL